MDGKELDENIQKEVERLWDMVTTENLNELSDYRGYQKEFLKLFGFGVDGVDYSADVSPEVKL
jgi:enoyl-[acyl-carrier protein] reductase/trans-2-enoyl-CoA reductase (NAD+)